MSRCVEVRTHSRLHFGLTSLGHDASRPQFGGVGLMVDASGVVLRVKPDQGFSISGFLQDRAQKVVATLTENWRLPSLPDVGIEVLSAPREHVGLGVGTQLALAVAAGLGEALGFAWRDPLRLAQLTKRGRRSAVGTYGFMQGGMIIDGGHRQDDPLGQLVERLDFPAEWRFVLFIPTTRNGCAGKAEELAFAELPAVPIEVTEQLEQIAIGELLPAARSENFKVFSESLYHYGSLAGKCFAAVQGGTFCSPETAVLIEWLRRQGVAGVGQSSWGPTVFALTADQNSADRLVQEFKGFARRLDYESLIAPAANYGAVVVTCEP